MPGQGRQFTRGNPGKPKGAVSGRTKALRAIDELLAREENVEHLRRGWQEALEKNPIGFWKKIVEPLLPKNATLEVTGTLSLVEMIERLGNDIIEGDRSNPASEE